MGHWAELDENNIVLRVIVIKKEMLDTGAWGDPSKWVKTSYNTRNGVHYVPSDDQNYSVPSEDQSKALRFRFAGKGMYYDSVNDVFYNPTPEFESWVFDKTVWGWVSPIEDPSTEHGKKYYWDEEAYQADTGNPKTKGWVEITEGTDPYS